MGVIQYFVGVGVDHGYVVGWPEGDEGGFAIVGEFDADRLNFVWVYAANAEPDFVLNLFAGYVDHSHRATNFSAGPQLFAIVCEFDVPWSLVNAGVVNQLMGRGVNPVQHAGGFRGVDGYATVGADGHAFGFNADINLAHHLFKLGVDHCDQGIFFVGDIKPTVVRVQGKLFRVFTGGQA